ncbi:MAG: hypothetical protein PHP86_04135 [Nevskiales bacterium]|nr:hypothetical protein [Nevskiales bacterium]
MTDISPDVKYVGDVTQPDEARESGAAKRLLFRTAKGKEFYVYESDDGRVWIDVSRLAEGERGSAIYAAVADYAYNTGQKFVGDPAGVSDVAVIRRTYNMLSSALRHGTTSHLDASPEQLKGIPSKGIPPLKWQGNDVAKVQALLDTLNGYAERNVPGFDQIRFDFGKRQFVDAGGAPVDFGALRPDGRGTAQRAADGRSVAAGTGAAPPGSQTLRASAFIASLLRSASSQRPGILEQVLRKPGQLVDGTGTLFRLADQAPPDGGVSRSESEFTAENRRLREQDKTAWNSAKKFWQRNFMPGGLLPKDVFDEKIQRDNELAVAEFDTSHLVGSLERVVREEYGKRFESLPEEDVQKIARALSGRVDSGIPERTRTAIVAMRQYIDRLSAEYVSVLEKQAADLEAAGDPESNAKADIIKTIRGNVGQYVHRSYRAFDDPKWFSKIPDATINAARRYLREQAAARGDVLPRGRAGMNRRFPSTSRGQ